MVIYPDGAEFENRYLAYAVSAITVPDPPVSTGGRGSLAAALSSRPLVSDRFGQTLPRLLIVDQFEQWLGDRPFVTGSELSVADVAMHGALSCVKSFPVYAEIMQRTKVAGWFDRVHAMRERNRAS